MLSEVQSLLFGSAAHQVAAQQTTPEYLLDQSERFADAFIEWTRSDAAAGIDDETGPYAVALYIRAFVANYRPGMRFTPEDGIRQMEGSLEGVLALQQASSNERQRSQAKAVAVVENPNAEKEARAEAARLAKAQREAEDAAAKANRKSEDDELLNPKTVASIPTEQLKIDPRAKKAYVKLGLVTVGDIETYAAAQPLAAVVGVGEVMAKATLAAIAKLYEADKARVAAEAEAAKTADEQPTGDEPTQEPG
jgi:hypothetical protein